MVRVCVETQGCFGRNLLMINQHGLKMLTTCPWSRILPWRNHSAAMSFSGGSGLKPEMIARSHLGKFLLLLSKISAKLSSQSHLDFAIFFTCKQLDHKLVLRNHSGHQRGHCDQTQPQPSTEKQESKAFDGISSSLKDIKRIGWVFTSYSFFTLDIKINSFK